MQGERLGTVRRYPGHGSACRSWSKSRCFQFSRRRRVLDVGNRVADCRPSTFPNKSTELPSSNITRTSAFRTACPVDAALCTVISSGEISVPLSITPRFAGRSPGGADMLRLPPGGTRVKSWVLRFPLRCRHSGSRAMKMAARRRVQDHLQLCGLCPRLDLAQSELLLPG